LPTDAAAVRSHFVLLLLLAVVLAACHRGPPMGTLKGKVTLDGQPVDGGLIRFVPADGNSQPEDCVVQGGNYTVTMPVGMKKVEVYWTKGGGKAVDTASQGTEQIVQLVPPKYNTQTTLTHELVEGEQEQDFALTSK
jgi:hypothetical protein